MKPTTEILARISQNSLANKEEVFTKLYRYLLRPDIYFVAYKNLYANNGAATKGVNEDMPSCWRIRKRCTVNTGRPVIKCGNC